MKLVSDWRTIMRIAKIDEIRKMVELQMTYFLKELDFKDAILQNLDKDIEDAEMHYAIALRNHFTHIGQLSSLQESRIKGLNEEFNKDIKSLKKEFDDESDEIMKSFKQERKQILSMRDAIVQEYQQKIDRV